MFDIKLLSLFFTLFAIVFAGPPAKLGKVVKVLSAEEARKAEGDLKVLLEKVANGGGPKYQIGKTEKVTEYVVGTFEYILELINVKNKNAKKNCTVVLTPDLNKTFNMGVFCEGGELFGTTI